VKRVIVDRHGCETGLTIESWKRVICENDESKSIVHYGDIWGYPAVTGKVPI
jgi:hypothetical protein